MIKKLIHLNTKPKKVLIVGVSYKKNIDDVRESAAIKIAKKLTEDNIITKYYDPFVKKLHFLQNGKKLMY